MDPIQFFSTEELEKELEKRKAVKPRATPESVVDLIEHEFIKNDRLRIISTLVQYLDWTPQTGDTSQGWDKGEMMNAKELEKILHRHKGYLKDRKWGKRANLSEADLSRVKGGNHECKGN